ncbi:hypothetical protein COLO4_20359 [Corchorus olitorius]|uniref:Uncharacterized protein n=1 Tax=Corchorus olitorius TaxID=93759 RepID=A0A1R3J083_9ROSI|nr:hypothetical protein COLO4_20359 [Corchorus olitorius]
MGWGMVPENPFSPRSSANKTLQRPRNVESSLERLLAFNFNQLSIPSEHNELESTSSCGNNPTHQKSFRENPLSEKVNSMDRAQSAVPEHSPTKTKKQLIELFRESFNDDTILTMILVQFHRRVYRQMLHCRRIYKILFHCRRMFHYCRMLHCRRMFRCRKNLCCNPQI